MRVLIFALLSLVSFGSVQEQNQRLKKTNLALRKALRSVTVEQGVGRDAVPRGRETKIGASNHGFKHVRKAGEQAVGCSSDADCNGSDFCWPNTSNGDKECWPTYEEPVCYSDSDCPGWADICYKYNGVAECYDPFMSDHSAKKEVGRGHSAETAVGGCYTTSGSCGSGYNKISSSGAPTLIPIFMCCPSVSGGRETKIGALNRVKDPVALARRVRQHVLNAREQALGEEPKCNSDSDCPADQQCAFEWLWNEDVCKPKTAREHAVAMGFEWNQCYTDSDCVPGTFGLPESYGAACFTDSQWGNYCGQGNTNPRDYYGMGEREQAVGDLKACATDSDCPAGSFGMPESYGGACYSDGYCGKKAGSREQAVGDWNSCATDSDCPAGTFGMPESYGGACYSDDMWGNYCGRGACSFHNPPSCVNGAGSREQAVGMTDECYTDSDCVPGTFGLDVSYGGACYYETPSAENGWFARPNYCSRGACAFHNPPDC